MAKEAAPKSKRENRLKQVWQVYRMTARGDKSVTPILLSLVIAPAALAIVITVALNQPWFAVVLWALVALMVGILVGLIILGRKAEFVAYSQIEGQPGAVGAMIRSSLRRGWIGNEEPIAVNRKTMDAVYRVVGRGGLVLLAEGPAARTRAAAEDEKRKLARVLPNVPITIISVGTEEGQVRLHKISSALSRVTRVLTRNEVQVVNARVSSLGSNVPIPKGIDPSRMRVSHRR
ncbi:MAG: DUF4191 family protein [Microbacteriaceae bacterium]|nr:DUF4191 family protein [Microbacteriaceae bacterium]